MSECAICDEQQRQGLPAIRLKPKDTTCSQCGRRVTQVLDLHHTKADLCSTACEFDFWSDL